MIEEGPTSFISKRDHPHVTTRVHYLLHPHPHINDTVMHPPPHNLYINTHHNSPLFNRQPITITFIGMHGEKPSLMASPNSATTEMSDHDQCLKYKGVRKRKWGKWVSEIRLPNSRERIWLGSYDSAEKAARAFDAALFCLRGDRANFNFPDTPFLFHLPHHPQPLTRDQIQLLASSFANQLHHHHQPQPEPPHETEPSAEFHSVSPVSVSETGSSSCTSSSSCMQVDVEEHGGDSTIDWSFLNSLDSDDLGAAIDCGLYSELDYFQFCESTTSSELLSLMPQDLPFDYNNAQENQYEDAYSHNSFLWNFGYDCS